MFLSAMSRQHLFLTALVALLSMAPLQAATNVFKCSIGGVVSYQSDPCPSGQQRRQPTVEQLNAERQKKLSEAKARKIAAPEAAPDNSRPPRSAAGYPAQLDQERAASTASPKAPEASPFRCDGRRYCAQMASCAEARYFLAHCSGVKMDGDRNGIPCERQWCNP